jgi:hypothetical protein
MPIAHSLQRARNCATAALTWYATALGLALVLGGCTATEQARLTAWGDSAHVKCYSGGVLIYEGRSVGRVYSPADSDGWQFKDATTGMLVEVSGDCVLVVGGD